MVSNGWSTSGYGSNSGAFLWPSRWMDLTPLVFYLWGQIKDIVYSSHNIDNLNYLIEKIIQAVNCLDPKEQCVHEGIAM